MSGRPFTPRALGEVAIRCRHLGPMIAFYEDVLGLTRLAGDHRGGIVFFAFGESHAGHTQVLALFEAGAPQNPVHGAGGAPRAGATSTLHHVALALPHEEQEAAAEWLRARGLKASFQDFGWIGWRGLFTEDPEGNTVELVARVP